MTIVSPVHRDAAGQREERLAFDGTTGKAFLAVDRGNTRRTLTRRARDQHRPRVFSARCR